MADLSLVNASTRTRFKVEYEFSPRSGSSIDVMIVLVTPWSDEDDDNNDEMAFERGISKMLFVSGLF
jgi:hypothetical protein